jgi:hypothetical protein
MWSSQGAKDSNKMNGTKSSLPYALGVSLERTRNGLPQVGKEKRANGSKTDQEHPQPPGEATPSSPWTRNRGQGRKSESDEDEEERFEWGTCKYGVRMSPAHPWYVGRGDETCAGEVVYTIQEIRTLLRSQPEDAKR